MTDRVRPLLALIGAVFLFAVPAALAADVSWTETARINHVATMRYKVESLTIAKTSWSARISFTNLSQKPITVGSQFGLSFYADRKTESLSHALGFALATKFSSALPTVLKPGATWSGVISGSGSLAADGQVYARVVFGPFKGMPGETRAVDWITDHATAVGSGSHKPADPGPVI
jgi:hypothetical protein